MVTPPPAAPPLSAEQRHCGCDWTTLARREQQEEDGVEELEELPVTKFKHGDKLINAVVQPSD